VKKWISILLAICILGGLLCGCAQESPSNETNPDSGSLSESGIEETQVPLDILETRYEDKQLVILSRDDGEWSSVEIFAEDGSADNISHAVYERNDMILQKYGVTILEYKKTSSEHQTAVMNEVSAPSGDFQAVTTSVAVASNMAMNSLLWDLNSEDNLYLDTSKPWWDERMSSGMEIGGKLFMVTGDLLTLDNDATFAIMFNKTIAEACKLPDLYDSVLNQAWTMEKMLEYEQLAVNDANGDGKLDYDSETAGFAYTIDTPYCLLYAGGVQLVSRDGEGELIYALDAERTQNIADQCRILLNSAYTTNLTANKDGAPIVEAGKTCFGGGHALFFGECLQCVTRLRAYDTDFGILPYPMYDQNQGGYKSLMHSTGSVIAIPVSVGEGDDMDMVSSMLEALACYSVNTLTKEYYEVNLKTKAARDERSGAMIDLIIGNRVCDLAYYFGWSNAVVELQGALLPGSSTGVASRSATYKKGIERSIERMLDTINKQK